MAGELFPPEDKSMHPKRILFVCVENANRSQMAEAFARLYGEGLVEAFSAGSRPAAVVNPKAVASMARKGYDLSPHSPKSFADIPQDGFHYCITMGCGDTCPLIAAGCREDWYLPDPRDFSPEEFDQVRDEIEFRVRHLLARLRAGGRGGLSPAARENS